MATYPGDYAVPGLIWPGFMQPGIPVTGGTAPPPSPSSTVLPQPVPFVVVLTSMGVA